MSIRDKKITDAQIKEKGVCAAPDTLTGTAAENKSVFDRLVREIVAPQFNDIVDTFADMEDSTTEWRGEEAKRRAAEAARANAENARVSAENARETQENVRSAAETDRDSAEKNRVSAEQVRTSAEADRVNAEDARSAAETQRRNSEDSRRLAENVRGENEEERQAQENSRHNNETARSSAELARATAETSRVSAENTRAKNENSRSAAENLRAENEGGRTSAETERASAEDVRRTAENNRSDAEAARASAETARAAAETQRKANEDARNVWESYDAKKAYKAGNKVVYSGSSYLCIKDSTGNVPTNTAYWRLIAAKGADGKGAGDMLASVYDPQGKKTDAFQYADDAAKSAETNARNAADAHANRKDNPHGVTAEDVGAVPTERKVNGKTLEKDVTLTGDDIAMGSDDAETLRAAMAKRVRSDYVLSGIIDFNNLNVPGFYRFNSNNGQLINAPSNAEYALMQVINYTDTTAQTVKNLEGKTYTRMQVANKWHEWDELARCVTTTGHSLPLADGWATYGTSVNWYCKNQFEEVTVYFRLKSTTTSIIDGITIASLPEGFRPGSGISIPGLATFSDYSRIPCHVDVDAGGSLKLYTDGSAPSGKTVIELLCAECHYAAA